MNGAAAHLAENGRSGVWRLAVTWTLLVAFALQTYVTQTHVHRAPAGPAAVAAVAGAVSAHSAAPADDEAIACPFCQAIASAGAFVGSAPLALGLPLVRPGSATSPPVIARLANAAAGFSWRSRAPPQT